MRLVTDFIIGQKHISKRLIAIQSALSKGENFNILFSGRSGYGKTHIMQALVFTIGKEDANFYVGNIFKPDKRIHVYDECHMLSPELFLYDKMVSRLYTILSATNYPGELQEAFINRHHFHLELSNYTKAELATIAYVSGKGILKFTDCMEIAERARFNPRVVNNIIKGLNIIRYTNVKEALDTLGYMEGGFTNKDYKYIEALEKAGGRAGAKTIARLTGMDQKYTEEVVEPFLLQKGLVHITPRGRVLT